MLRVAKVTSEPGHEDDCERSVAATETILGCRRTCSTHEPPNLTEARQVKYAFPYILTAFAIIHVFSRASVADLGRVLERSFLSVSHGTKFATFFFGTCPERHLLSVYSHFTPAMIGQT